MSTRILFAQKQPVSRMNNFTDLAKDLLQRAALYQPDASRRPALETLIQYIQERAGKGAVRLNFICTHNSRRSQIAQILAQVLAEHLHMDWMQTFSGGTEVTAFHPHAVAALVELGVHIDKPEDGTNPRYRIRIGSRIVNAFSKLYSHPDNPQKHFAAVMVCSQADAGCPFVPGAERRIALPFDDPKASDGTPKQAETYRTRALEIGTELAWVFQRAV
jgi:arsenate reductase